MNTGLPKIPAIAVELLIASCALWGCTGDAPPKGGAPAREESPLVHAKRLSAMTEHGRKERIEVKQYVDELGKRKDLKSLEAIYKADFPFSQYALTEYCRVADPDKAIALCTTFRLDSPSWLFAMSGAVKHPKEKVIGYLHQVATSKVTAARCWCYEICKRENWSDLLPEARRDLRSDEDISPVMPGANLLTVGQVAEDYLNSFPRPTESPGKKGKKTTKEKERN